MRYVYLFCPTNPQEIGDFVFYYNTILDPTKKLCNIGEPGKVE